MLRKRIADAGVEIPIIPGVMLVSNPEKLAKFCNMNEVSIPEDIKEKMSELKGHQNEWNDFAVEMAARQMECLFTCGTKFFHLYTLNDPVLTCGVLEAVNIFKE